MYWMKSRHWGCTYESMERSFSTRGISTVGATITHDLLTICAQCQNVITGCNRNHSRQSIAFKGSFLYIVRKMRLETPKLINGKWTKDGLVDSPKPCNWKSWSGTVPVSWLIFRARFRKFAIRPSCVGIEPTNSFISRPRESKQYWEAWFATKRENLPSLAYHCVELTYRRWWEALTGSVSCPLDYSPRG